ncbi:MAG: glycosyltransferase [Bacteroidetes bacterium]|nr:glycosyltransferase [Bacteroidota bacterium]
MSKIAIINARNIFPMNGGDKIFSINLLKILSKSNEICYINIIDEDAYNDQEEAGLLSFGRIDLKVEQIRFLNTPYAILKSSLLGMPFLAARRPGKRKMKEKLNKYFSDFSPEIIIWDQIRSASYIVSFPGAKNILIEHNDESAIYRQRGASKNKFARKFYNFQANLLEQFTKKIHQEMDRVIYLNKENIRTGSSPEKYRAFPFLFTSFSHGAYQVKEENKIQLLFVGAMDWYPNRDGIKWFIENVLPLLPQNFELKIVGRDASKAFMGANFDRVSIHSDVASIEPFYLSADIFISPVFTGSGINIKILEAASYGIPIMATPFSLRGYQEVEFIPQADQANDFADIILQHAAYPKRLELNAKLNAWYSNYVCRAEASVQQFFHVN